jgi:diguanylate cyclase (GGDEF)-like protein/PAS domain S-box-containing protein
MPRGGHRWTAGCGKRLHAVAAALALALAWLLLAAAPAEAQLRAIDITEDSERLDISQLGEFHEPQGDQLTVEMAAGDGGVPQRVRATASFPGTNPAWFSFALRNTTDKQIERWLVVDRYNSAGSGVVWPDLDARRVEKVSHSLGYAPQRIRNDRADIFRLTLEPGQTVTYIAELTSDRFARLHLWSSLEYEQRDRDRQLFYGIMLGITGLLAIFLTAVFAANHKAIFPAAAIFTWCVLAYLCVDFGFWQKLFSVRPEENAQYRAATEAAMVASLLAFLYVFLRLSAWHGFVRTLIWLWIAAQAVLVGVAFLDPRLAATFARLSSVAIGGWGAVVILFLALRGQDRALSLVPTWMLLLVWLFGAGATLIGRLGGDFPVFLLTAGLVLIVVLLGFTVTQFAFRAQEPQYGVQPGEQQLRALAVDGAGAAVWEWSARRDEIKVGQIVENMLGLKPGELSTRVESFAAHMHPADRERFKLLLWSMNERAGGEMRIEFRMRHADNSYRWFELEAAGVPTSDRRNLRCVGLLREVTDAKRAQERLLHNAVHDSLSGLPNRELFLDRLAIATKRATLEPLVRPSLLFIDIDKFKAANTAFGLVAGDSLLLTVARRLARNLGPQDTLARMGGDQFAMLLLNQTDPRELAMLAEQVRRSIRSPINIAGQGVVLTASIGIAIYDGPDEDPAELLREAEIAMYRAKRSGSDRVEIFNAEMRAAPDDRVALEDELRSAIEKKQLRLVYQPIFYLPTETLAGFEALLRWEHPRLGTLNPTHFVPVAEESDLIVKLGSYALTRAVREAQRWQRELPRPDQPLFVSVNVSSRQLFKPELINEVRHVLGRAVLPKGSLRLELAEALAMENPDRAIAVLEQLSAAGAGLALDGFATGYSSFSYLNQFTFDAVKVDPAFVQGRSRGGGTAMLRSIVALAHELGKNVVAEGVEAEDDVAFLRSIGCEFAQGAYYGDGMSERDVLQLLKVVRRAERRLKKSSTFRQRAKARSEAATPPHAAAAATQPPPGARPSPMAPPPPQPMPPQAAPQSRMPPPPNGSAQPPPATLATVPPPQVQSPGHQVSPPLPLRAPPHPLTEPGAQTPGLQKAAAPPKPPIPPPAERRPAVGVPPPVQAKAPAAASENKPATPAPNPPPSPLREPAPAAAPTNGAGKSHPAKAAAAPKPPGVTIPPGPPPPSAPPTRTAPNVFSSGSVTRPPFLTGGGPASPPSQNARPPQPQPQPAPATAQSPARARPLGPDLSKLPPAIRASLAKLAGELAPEDEKSPPGSPPPSTST